MVLACLFEGRDGGMDHDDVAVVYRVSPAERLILGTLVPAGLCALGIAVFVLTESWAFPLAYGLVGLAIFAAVRRARLELTPDGIVRVNLRRRFVRWHDIREVLGGYQSGGEAGQVRLDSGELFRLRPLGADKGTADYDTAVRVVHAVHLSAARAEAAGIEHPLELAPRRARRLVPA